MQAFSSVRSLIDQYYLFGFLPLLKPLSAIPFAPSSFLSLEVHDIVIDMVEQD